MPQSQARSNSSWFHSKSLEVDRVQAWMWRRWLWRMHCYDIKIWRGEWKEAVSKFFSQVNDCSSIFIRANTISTCNVLNFFRHFAVNACLMPVCAADMCHITTVEGIGSTQTRLHPIQTRIAHMHGSQCGKQKKRKRWWEQLILLYHRCRLDNFLWT